MMKSKLIKKIKKEFGIRKVNGKKLELYDFHKLCSFYKKLSNGLIVK